MIDTDLTIPLEQHSQILDGYMAINLALADELKATRSQLAELIEQRDRAIEMAQEAADLALHWRDTAEQALQKLALHQAQPGPNVN
jgi:hypothetical protein